MMFFHCFLIPKKNGLHHLFVANNCVAAEPLCHGKIAINKRRPGIQNSHISFIIYMVEYTCKECKKTKTFTEMAYYAMGCSHPKISKTCRACRESKKEAEYIKKFIKRHKLLPK